MALAPLILVRDFFPQLPIPTVFVALIFAGAGVFVGRRVVRWYFSLIDHHASESDLLLLGASAACATALCVSTFFLESYLYYVVVAPQKAVTPMDLTGLLLLMWFLPAFLMLERVVQNITGGNWANWVKNISKQWTSTASEERVPWYAMPLNYFFYGAANCLILYVRSDKKAVAAYALSFFLTIPSLLPGVIGLGFGLAAFFLSMVACWRFLTIPINFRRSS
jgi:hypothetical protein